MRYLFLFAFLLTAAASQAAPVVRTVDLELANPMEEIGIDLDKNGSVDFELFYDVFEQEPFLHINVPTSLQMTNKVVVTGEHNTMGKDLAAKLPAGYGIYEGSEFNGQIFGNGPLMAQPSFAGNNILEGRGKSFVGFSFRRNGEIHYGWMTVEVNSAGTIAKVTALAYESVAERKIFAGAQMSVEEASSGSAIKQVGARLFELSEVAEVTVIDLLGREVLQSTGQTLDLSELEAGVYLVRVRSREGDWSLKLRLD